MRAEKPTGRIAHLDLFRTRPEKRFVFLVMKALIKTNPANPVVNRARKASIKTHREKINANSVQQENFRTKPKSPVVSCVQKANIKTSWEKSYAKIVLGEPMRTCLDLLIANHAVKDKTRVQTPKARVKTVP